MYGRVRVRVCARACVCMHTLTLVESPPPLSPLSPSRVDEAFIFNYYQRHALNFIWNLGNEAGFPQTHFTNKKGEAQGV